MKYLIVLAHPEAKSFNASLVNEGVKALTAAGHEVQVSNLFEMKWDPVSDRRNFKTTKDPEFFKQQGEEAYAIQNDGFAEDVKAEQDKVFWCDVLVFQFPLHWFSVPSILKGWVDKIFAMGKTYGMGKWYSNGVFKGKRAFLSITTGGPASMYTGEGSLAGDMSTILHPINSGIFRFCGFTVLPQLVHWCVAHVPQEVRVQYIEAFKAKLLNAANEEPIPYPTLEQFDSTFQLKK